MSRKTYEIDEEKELQNCNFVKAMLMICVVAYHSMLFWSGFWFIGEPVYTSDLLSILSRWFNSFHIYGFVLVSGYLFYYLKFEIGRYNNFLLFVRNKAKRLLVPFVFVAIIWVIPLTQLFFHYSMKELIRKYVLAVSPSQLWFLVMLFFVFLLSYLLADYLRKDFIGFTVAIIFYGIGIAGDKIFPNIFQIWTVFRYIIFFLIGFKIRQHGSKFLAKIPSLIFVLTDVGIFVLVQYLPNYKDAFSKLLYIVFSFLLNVVGALMIFTILQRFAEKIDWKSSKLFNLFSKNSMTIYLFHQQFIYLLIYWLNGYVNPYMHTLINFICAMLFSLAISVLLNKFEGTRFLIGEK